MFLLYVYQKITALLCPLVHLYLLKRLKNKKEDAVRFKERFGITTMLRPKGKLIWMHGASVGECLSMLPLIKKILSENSMVHVMVTSGTVTSASLLTKRLPERSFHQYYPVDCPKYVNRFLTYWKPDVAFFFESEFWPNMLASVRKREIPLVLLNGRVSDKAFADWQKHIGLSRALQQCFTLSFGQTKEDAARLSVLGAKETLSVGNLKYASNPMPYSEEELSKLKSDIGNRPTFLMASTHDNEEEMGGLIHLRLKEKYPDMLTIIAPRHTERHDLILRTLENIGLNVALRSKGEQITPETDIYLADTMGEMSLIYKLSPIIFVGGSLIPFGGQNMIEGMREGAVVFVGPHAFNFREIVRLAEEAGALRVVADESELEQRVSDVIDHIDDFQTQREEAKKITAEWEGVVERLYPHIQKWVQDSEAKKE